MTEEKPRTHRKQDDKYFKGLTEEKPLSEEERIAYIKGFKAANVEELKRVDRLKEDLKNDKRLLKMQIPFILEHLEKRFGDFK